MSWSVHERYEVLDATLPWGGEGPCLFAWGRELLRYEPLKEPALAGELAKVKTERGLVKFTSRYGLLWPDVALSVEWCLDHAANVRDLLDYAKDGALPPGTVTIPGSNPGEPYTTVTPHKLPHTDLYVMAALNPNLGDYRYYVLSEPGQPLQLQPRAATLLAAIYYHVAEAVTGGRRLRRCDNDKCKALFVVTDDRQRYCPAPDFWRGKTGSLCSAAARQREQRRRKGEADAGTRAKAGQGDVGGRHRPRKRSNHGTETAPVEKRPGD